MLSICHSLASAEQLLHRTKAVWLPVQHKALGYNKVDSFGVGAITLLLHAILASLSEGGGGGQCSADRLHPPGHNQQQHLAPGRDQASHY